MLPFLQSEALKHFMETWLHYVFPIGVYAICLSVGFRECLDVLRKPGMLVRTFLVANVFSPLVTAGVVKLFDVPIALIGGVMLIGSVAAGDSFDVVEGESKKGSLAVASTVMVILVFLMPLTVPAWLWVFGGWFSLHHLTVPPGTLFAAVAPITALPAVLAISTRTLFPAFSAWAQPVLKKIFLASVVVIALYYIVPSVKAMLAFNTATFAAIFACVSLAVVAGYYLTGGATRKERISLALSVSLGNLVVIVLVAMVSYKVDVTFTVFAFVLVRALILTLWHMVQKLIVAGKGETLG
jgi:predicted Na+-dependent transporter